MNDVAAAPGGAGGEGQDPPKGSAIERKIIYKATLTVQVENFGTAEEKLEQLIDEFHGILDKEEINGSPGVPRSGYWKIRLPPGNLQAFRNEVLKLGDQQVNKLGSEDVTEEFYDLSERIKSKEKELDTYRGMYTQAKTIQDAIAVKRELDRAQEELDRFKGRLNLLRSLSDMTTVEVHLRERGAYLPDDNPTFGVTISRVWSGSWNALLQVGKFLALCCVALAPWSPIILCLAAAPYVWWRRRRARTMLKAAGVTPANP